MRIETGNVGGRRHQASDSSPHLLFFFSLWTPCMSLLPCVHVLLIWVKYRGLGLMFKIFWTFSLLFIYIYIYISVLLISLCGTDVLWRSINCTIYVHQTLVKDSFCDITHCLSILMIWLHDLGVLNLPLEFSIMRIL